MLEYISWQVWINEWQSGHVPMVRQRAGEGFFAAVPT